MSKETAIIFVICWSITIISFYKWYLIYKKISTMNKHKCICTDTTKRTTYQKNIYIYYYTYSINNEEYSTSDQTSIKLPLFTPKINDELEIYVNEKNPNSVITPLEIYYFKLYKIIIILFFILPFLFIL